MQWLNRIVDEAIKHHPDGEIIVSSGVSPSGTYHLGTLREVLTAEAVMWELKNRGRQSRHLHIVDDLDVFRKVPKGINEKYQKYLGRPLCDVPAPDGSHQSYADYYLADLLEAAKPLGLEMEVVRSHEKYRQGFFVPAIEQALAKVEDIKEILQKVSGRQLDKSFSPIQIMEDGYLKTRQFVQLNPLEKNLTYVDVKGKPQIIKYDQGDVKLNWRIDWPARWWLMKVNVEPFGRDHATKGGSYDTGEVIEREVFYGDPPIPVPYNFINRTGDTKKMSKSAGDTVTAAELLKVLPPELVWFFVLRYGPEKLLFYDQGPALIKLFDDFGELLAKPDKTAEAEQLIKLCMHGSEQPIVSSVPFSHLVASYQAALRNPDKTLEIISRTEHADVLNRESETIKNEFKYIDEWLNNWAPEEVKFELTEQVSADSFSDLEKQFLAQLADLIDKAPANADGEWFHKAIYSLKDSIGLEPKQLFGILYQALIDKSSGPRAGWFLSILPRDWLVKRLRFET
jgi:lysyl-tRNA synthetase class 1